MTVASERPRAPRLAVLAQQIEIAFPDLQAAVDHGGGYCNTDRQIPGTRLRRPGKGRRGNLLLVRTRKELRPERCVGGKPHAYGLGPHCRECGRHRDGIVFTHNAAETYRRNEDVVRWIDGERWRRKYGPRDAPWEWMTTGVNEKYRHKTHSADDGARGWRVHAVRVAPGEIPHELRRRRAACGTTAAHGWSVDLFVEHRCARCESALAKE